MDSERFDRWAKLLAQRMSRRTAATALGAATVASLTSPRWALGQVDDDDQDDDVDQHKDNPTGEDPDTDDMGFHPCLPITRCGRQHCTSGNGIDGGGECHFDDIGEIPGQLYYQELTWNVPPCQPVSHTMRELEAMCNAAYPGDDCPHCCGGECLACADFALFGCH